MNSVEYFRQVDVCADRVHVALERIYQHFENGNKAAGYDLLKRIQQTQYMVNCAVRGTAEPSLDDQAVLAMYEALATFVEYETVMLTRYSPQPFRPRVVAT